MVCFYFLRRVCPIEKRASIFPHRPLVVAVTSGNRLLFHALAVGAFIPAPFRSGNYVRSSLRIPTLHYACIPASTSAPRGISIPLLTPYISLPQSYPCHFLTHFHRLPSFLRRVSPNEASPFGFGMDCFFFQKDSKNKYKTNFK
jgi:hypothetical protein